MSRDPLRLLIFHPALPPYRVDLFNALAERAELRLVFLRPNLLSQRFDQDALRARLRADHRHLTRGFTVLRRTIRFGLGREIEEFRPDVVVTSEFSPVTLAVALHRLVRRSFAHVVWTDDNPFSVQRDNAVRRALRPVLLLAVNGLILLSDEAAALYRERYRYPGPIGVAPILHDEKAFRDELARSLPMARETIDAWHLEGCRVVLFVGRLVPEKRPDRLVRAFAHVATEHADARLVLVGDGPERAALERLVASLGLWDRVVFTGRLEGAPLLAWFAIASVFALCSEFEPYGAVVNEALLAGVPVVCDRNVGARILIREGENGSVLDTTDGIAVARALAHFLDGQPPLEASRMLLRRSIVQVGLAQAADAFCRCAREALSKTTSPGT